MSRPDQAAASDHPVEQLELVPSPPRLSVCRTCRQSTIITRRRFLQGLSSDWNRADACHGWNTYRIMTRPACSCYGRWSVVTGRLLLRLGDGSGNAAPSRSTWTRTERGKKMPLDADHVADHDQAGLFVLRETERLDGPLAIAAWGLNGLEPHYCCHFDTCADRLSGSSQVSSLAGSTWEDAFGVQNG